MAKAFTLYNTLTRAVAPVKPVQPGYIGLYVCGITPYDHSHIGHGRCMIVYDTLVRFLKATGWRTTYVRNFTDIDDKIIARAKERGEGANEIAARYIASFTEDMVALNCESPDVEPRVTTHLADITKLIQKLVDKGIAYVGSSGDVLYEVGKFKPYGKLSRKALDDLIAGARVAVDEGKRHPADFVLWKKAKPGEPSWPSPWGDGRPGWHIECSAMSCRHLGETFDIHGGGQDLTFPHHENEIAQSEGAHGHYVNVWMHTAFVQVNAEKMSKSLGNFTFIKDLLKRVSGEALRLYILQTHYRHPLDFTPEALDAAETNVAALYRLLDRLGDGPVGTLPEAVTTALADDLNTPAALAWLMTELRELNRRLDKGEPVADRAPAFRAVAQVLGVGAHSAARYFHGQAHTLAVPPEEIDTLIQARLAARKAKNWAEADRIRNDLAAQGILLEDKGDTTTWRRA
jgi:cysteinyl-tRNA synthetase